MASTLGNNNNNNNGKLISAKINNLSKSQLHDGQQVELHIALPDRTTCSLTIKSNACADDVYAALAEKLQLDTHISGFFYLFEVIDSSFGKIIKPFTLVYII
jgi:hypothetical protein